MKARKTKGEGWDVFDSRGSSDGAMQICKIDDPSSSIPDNDPRRKRNPSGHFTEAFKGDGEAVKHVLALAKKGDVEAINALWLVIEHDGLVNRLLWCAAMGWTGRDAAGYPEGFNEAWPQFAQP